MTYCIGMKTTEGLVFASDSRTNAGLDNYSTYKKMFSCKTKEFSGKENKFPLTNKLSL